MRRLAGPLAILAVFAAAPAARAQCDAADAPRVPGAEMQKAACLADLTTAGTVASGHTRQTDWAGLHASGTRNPSGVPGLQLDGYFPDTSATNTNNGWFHDAQFVIRLPERWNGGLVVTGAPGVRAQYANDFIIGDWVLARGYAFAATDKGNTGTAFYRDGVRPGDAIAEWHARVRQLTMASRRVAAAHYGGGVRRTYMAGISNGGYLTRMALERDPELYDGGVDWEGTLFRAEGPNILTYLPATLRDFPRWRATGDQAAHDRIVAAGFAPGSEFLWDDHYAEYWDLTQRIYREELDPEYDGPLEAGIPFCQPGTPSCDADYDYASRPKQVANAVGRVSPSGRIGQPLLSLHGSLDTLLPISRDGRVYERLVRDAGRGASHRFYEIAAGNHVDGRYDRFPARLRPLLPCQRAAFQALEAWVERRREPPADQVVPKPSSGDPVNECTLAGSPGVSYTGALAPAPRRCLARSARFHANGVGRVRVRSSRAALRRRAGSATSRRGRRSRYCVGGGGAVTAVFSRRGRAGLVGGKDFDRRPQVAELERAIESLEHTVHVPSEWDELLSEPAELEFEQVPFDHPLWVLYSSGTTGLPKAIVQGQGGILIEHLKKSRLHLDLSPGDRFLWFTTTGWMMWNFLVGGLLSGATIVLYDGNPGHPDMNGLWRFAEAAGITTFGTSPGFIAGCQKAGVSPGEAADLSRMSAIGSTGAPLPTEAFEWVYDHVKRDLWLFSTSGGTDLCTAFVGGCPLLPVHAGELQAPALGAKVEAFDPEGRPLIGEVGELVISQPMPSMPLFFWNDPDGERLRESYFETYPGVWRHGDWIKITERGTAVISGRSDSTINRGGVRMGTSEIYSAVESLPEVLDSLVIDVPRDQGGSFMPLFVVLREGAEVDDELVQAIRARVREHCSPRHVPDKVLAVDEVPRTLSGKKLEVPVKKILMGTPAEEAASRDSLSNPKSLDYFAGLEL